MLRTDRSVIKPGGNRVCPGDLAVFILKDVAESSLQDTFTAATESCCMFTQCCPSPAGFHSDHLDRRIAKEFVEVPDCVASTTNTRNEQIGQPALPLYNLCAGF